MQIESCDKKSNINIDYVDSELERYPSVCVSVSANDQGFGGFNKDVWFELDLLKEFIQNLKELDSSRKGSASIESMSPEEFQITIETYDLSGHMVLKYTISKYAHIPYLRLISLTGGFELDASMFSCLISDFIHLADGKNYPPPKFPFIKE